ncbi:MAG: DNRLRE domain-containing protein [Candidatus Cloacimonadales bacterium]|nr:DNRLRE domain-containing protein [Candidatus Cloacimonadales bacterium]
MKKLVMILSILVISASIMIADTVIIVPCDDMYTDPDHPGTNPTITELWTADFNPSGHFERIMIKFDISPYIGQTADSAILHLTRFYSCPSGGTTASTFYAITEEWTEETWDHTVHIQYDPSASMPYVFSGNGGNTIVQFEVDITDFINTFLEGSFENNGFIIKANPNQKFSKFYSKEYSNTNYRPSLAITFPDIDVDEQEITGNIEFLRNYPNPFNPETTISFLTTENTENTEILIYNLKGQIVKTFLIHNPSSIIPNQIIWNGRDESNNPVTSGIYFYRIKTDNSIRTNKMLLLR